MKTIILIAIIAAVAAPIYAAEEVAAEKKHDKRGVLGLGYGGYYSGLGGYGGYGHVASPVLSHGILPASYSHAPLSTYGHLGGYHAAPAVYSAPLRLGYSGYSGLGYSGYNGLGHGLGLGHGYHGVW